MLKFGSGFDSARTRSAATTSVVKFPWDRTSSISSASKLSSLSRSTAASTRRPSAEMKSARPGSEVEASEFCVSGTTKFSNRLKACWKRFVSSCSSPHPNPPPQAGEGKVDAPHPQAGEGIETPQAGEGEVDAPTLPSPASGGGNLKTPQAGEGIETPQAG